MEYVLRTSGCTAGLRQKLNYDQPPGSKPSSFGQKLKLKFPHGEEDEHFHQASQSDQHFVGQRPSGWYVRHRSEGFREKEQEKELTNPALKSLGDDVATMTPHPTLAARFHKLFVQNYTNLLLFKQEYNNVRITPTHDPQLVNWVKNMKTQIRYLMQGTGRFITDSCYVQYLTKIDVTISKDSDYQF
jgi:hypothetical protein